MSEKSDKPPPPHNQGKPNQDSNSTYKQIFSCFNTTPKSPKTFKNKPTTTPKTSSEKPKIIVLNKKDQPLKIIEEPVRLKIVPEITVLERDNEARALAKIQESDVSEIMDQPEEMVDLEEAWGEPKKSLPIGWFILAALIACGLGGWATMSLFDAQPQIEAADEEKQEILIDLEKEEKEVKQTLGKMEDCVREYLAADTIEKMLPYVRHSDRVKPLMEHYYQTHTIQPGAFQHFKRIRSMGMGGQSFVYGRMELNDGTSRKVLIEQLNDGTFKVDWESDVCYLPMKWDQYIEKHPAEPIDMRVQVIPDNFYAYEFRDESQFDCYKITTLNADEHLFGFVVKGSPTAIDIEKIISKAQEFTADKPQPMILRLRFPKNSASKRCVWIDQMLSSRWTYVNPPEKRKTEN